MIYLSSAIKRRNKRAARWKQFDEALTKREDMIKAAMERKFRSEGKAIVAAIEGMSAGLTAAGKPDIKVKIGPLKKTIAGAQAEQLKKWVAELTVLFMNSGKTFAAQTAIAMQFRFPGFPETAKEWIDKHVPKLVDAVDTTSLARIERQVVKGIEKGENLRQIQNRITATYDNFIRSRPSVIARTEAGMIASITQKAVIDDLPIPKKELQKTWTTAMDDRVRDEHASLEDVTVPYNELFPNGLRFPRDPNGPPESIINCRCTMIVERVEV